MKDKYINIQAAWETPRKMNSKAHTNTHYNLTFQWQKQTQNLESSKTEVTSHEKNSQYHHEQIFHQNLGGPKVVKWYIPSGKKKIINEEYYIWKNHLSSMRDNFKDLQINEIWESLLHWTCPARNGSVGGNKRTLDSCIKLYKEIMMSIKLYT